MPYVHDKGKWYRWVTCLFGHKFDPPVFPDPGRHVCQRCDRDIEYVWPQPKPEGSNFQGVVLPLRVTNAFDAVDIEDALTWLKSFAEDQICHGEDAVPPCEHCVTLKHYKVLKRLAEHSAKLERRVWLLESKLLTRVPDTENSHDQHENSH